MEVLLTLHAIKESVLKIEKTLVDSKITADSAISLESILEEERENIMKAVKKIKLSLGHREFIKKAGCTEAIFYRRLKSCEIAVNNANCVLDIKENYEAVKIDKRFKK